MDKRNRNFTAGLTGVLAVALVMMLLHVWRFNSMTALVYEVHQQRLEILKFQEENARLQANIARLQALPRISEIAEDQLGMKRTSIKPVTLRDQEKKPDHWFSSVDF